MMPTTRGTEGRRGLRKSSVTRIRGSDFSASCCTTVATAALPLVPSPQQQPTITTMMHCDDGECYNTHNTMNSSRNKNIISFDGSCSNSVVNTCEQYRDHTSSDDYEEHNTNENEQEQQGMWCRSSTIGSATTASGCGGSELLKMMSSEHDVFTATTATKSVCDSHNVSSGSDNLAVMKYGGCENNSRSVFPNHQRRNDGGYSEQMRVNCVAERHKRVLIDGGDDDCGGGYVEQHLQQQSLVAMSDFEQPCGEDLRTVALVGSGDPPRGAATAAVVSTTPVS
eukprot:Lankesteria_metandrocarpae@DN10677_c0_g1_i1.p1